MHGNEHFDWFSYSSSTWDSDNLVFKRQIKGNCDTIVSSIGEDILLISVTNNVRKPGERIVQSKL